jgi:predicted DNA-binding mobile mystery protein A
MTQVYIDYRSIMTQYIVMKTLMNDLRLRQTEAMLADWKQVRKFRTPPSGWISAIRLGLGMSYRSLAKRLDVVPTTVQRLERNEVEGTITVESLRRVAESLDCELVYALIPRRSLTETLEDQARTKARATMASVIQTMNLEAQATSEGASRDLEDRLSQELLQGSRRKLWS